MRELSGGVYKGNGFVVEYQWKSLGKNADFSMWCRIGKWCGLNDRRLSKLELLAAARELMSEFPAVLTVRVCDSQGVSAERHSVEEP